MSRFFAIGDIHGCSKTLRKLLDQLNLSSGDTVATCGDMFDRGPDTKGTIEILLTLRRAGIILIPVAGNHELMWMDLLRISNPNIPEIVLEGLSAWVFVNYTSTAVTARSYGQAYEMEDLGGLVLPPEHLEFMQSLVLYHHQYFGADEYVLAHAGMCLGALRKQTALEAIAFNFEHQPDSFAFEVDTIVHTPNFAAKIVHGHVPWHKICEKYISDSSIQFPGVHYGRINIDGACGYGITRGVQARLVAVELPEQKFYIQDRLD